MCGLDGHGCWVHNLAARNLWAKLIVFWANQLIDKCFEYCSRYILHRPRTSLATSTMLQWQVMREFRSQPKVFCMDYKRPSACPSSIQRQLELPRWYLGYFLAGLGCQVEELSARKVNRWKLRARTWHMVNQCGKIFYYFPEALRLFVRDRLRLWSC
jgi:hypothetical protein